MGISQIGFPQNTVYRSRVQTSETLPVTLQANKYGIFSFDISAGDGITPLGIVGWGCNETSQTFIHEYYMNENGQTAELYLKNPYFTDVSITSLWIDVLYTKIGLDMSEVTVVDNLTTDSGIDALSAKQGKVLDEKIENFDLEYEGYTLPANLTSNITSGGITVALYGKMAVLRVVSTYITQSTQSWCQIGTLPEKYRPVARAMGMIMDDTLANRPAEFIVETDGSVKIWNTTNGHIYWGSIVYITV